MPEQPYSPDHDACGVGFVTRLGAAPSREVVDRALVALERLAHRGGMDADGRSGDGAGLLLSLPDAFFRRAAKKIGFAVPEHYAVGMVFVLRDAPVEALVAEFAPAYDLCCLGWREVPTDPSVLGARARDTLPQVRQCFVAPASDPSQFESRLFRFRKHLEAQLDGSAYFCSLSSRLVVYKGLLTPTQLPAFYADLADPAFDASFAIFHQRYSTNTQPSWTLAQPFRHVAHNGEINTISGNRRWMRAKEGDLREALQLAPTTRILEPRASDSASFDNAVETFLRRGDTIAEALLTLVPPAWESNPLISPELRRFLEQRFAECEPWDGPAALVFTDGVSVGAKLDRNGLRPLRHSLTSDGWLVAGSEAGIADFRSHQIVERQRLGPGEMILATPGTGEFLRPAAVGHRSEFASLAHAAPHTLITPAERIANSGHDLRQAMGALGWTDDQYKLLFRPLVTDGQEAVWSMGDDATPAFLSRLRRSLWDYCKQRFAQVTNPPIDPLRETQVMSLRVPVTNSLALSSPLVDEGQLEHLAQSFEVVPIDLTFAAAAGVDGARALLRSIPAQLSVLDGCSNALVFLDDSRVNAERSAIPALLATAAAWNALVAANRWHVPLIVKTGQVLDAHHIALLMATGASGVFPALALEEASRIRPDGVARYRFATEKALRKIISRMGVSTVASYRNSQLFEVLGLDTSACSEFFPDAGCVPGSKTLDQLLADCIANHALAFATEPPALTDAGLYRFRRNGEQHGNAPEVVRRMHRLIQSPSEENRAAFEELAGDRTDEPLRLLLTIQPRPPIAVDDVESETSLLGRFSTQAMSLGAVSPETHSTLAQAMNMLGARSNSGEGGEDSQLYRSQPEATNRVKQIASGRFGVTTEYLVQAEEIEIKIAQGAKPGEGGQLPSSKVTAYIARLRHAVPGTVLISPPPHHDIYSIEDLAQLIYDLRAVNPQARIGVKLVSSTGVGIIATGVAKAGADVITIAGHDGGTGASALASIKNTGLPWEVGLRDAHRTLTQSGLRSRVRLRVDGGLKFARDIVIAALLGAEEFGFGTAALLAIGCVMARQCHLNTCPVGIATQDETLRARFNGKPEMVVAYFKALAAEVRSLLAGIGASSITEIVGDIGRLRPRREEDAKAVEVLLRPPQETAQLLCPREDDAGLAKRLNAAAEDLDTLRTRGRRFRITNADRAIGAHLSGRIVRRHGPEFAGIVACEFTGTAGQSFGAFLVRGMKFRLRGEANDYVGKGLSGGSIAITAGEAASHRGDVLAGNTILYGATGGELYIAGRAGERFAVRNSGALGVVEGLGQHGCEYMTAGIVLVLGSIGLNFGAGMTGGLAYLLRDALSGHDYNLHSVVPAPIEVREELWLRAALRRHFRLTGSPKALALLTSDHPLPFLRVQPLQPACTPMEAWGQVAQALSASEAFSDQISEHTPADPLVV
jgi:glutamate synthase domain-containing protein 2/glutamate synthase domain-containing protein 1/glutamate synthase domain-containing protein 3